MVRIVEVEERSAALGEEVGGGVVSIYDQKPTRKERKEETDVSGLLLEGQQLVESLLDLAGLDRSEGGGCQSLV